MGAALVVCPYLQPGHHSSQGDPGGSGGARHRQDRRACGQGGGGEKKRKRKEKRPNTSSHRKGSGKGSGKLNRRVQAFFGKAPARPRRSPCCSITGPAVPSRGTAGATRGEPGQPPASQQSWIWQQLRAPGLQGWGSPARTGTDGSFSETARARRCWNNPTAKEVALPRVTSRLCPQGVCRSSVTSRGHFKATALCATLCCRCGRARSAARGHSEVGSAGKGQSPARAESEPPAAPAERGAMCQPDAQSAAPLPRPTVTHKQSCSVFFPLQKKKKEIQERGREISRRPRFS